MIGENSSLYIDLFLTMVMVAVGLRSLVLSRDAGAKAAARWRNELRELQDSLKSLIGEASNASASLDRRLVRRREELETLLAKIEKQAAKLPVPTRSERAPTRSNRYELEQEEEELDVELDFDLPNPSWEIAAKPATRPATRPSRRVIEEAIEEDDSFLELSERIQDEVTLSSAPARRPAGKPTARPAQTFIDREAPAPRQSTKGIHSEVEVQSALNRAAKRAVPAPRPQTEIFERPSIMEPTTYSIARRLLARGTELHIVARKLDVPLAEVRLLDKLMRSEGDGRATEEELSHGYRKTEHVPIEKIVRPADADELDEIEIFRETTTI